MSGHSKWANIRIRKTAQDARRGKIYMKHARLIEIAAREGGSGHPNTNARLRQAIENARADNVPNANIERAVKKGGGALKDGAQTVEMLYEAFGPGGTAFIIEGFTDNRNRSLANLKATLNRNDARLAETGAVSWMFERKGVAVATPLRPPGSAGQAGEGRETLELQLIDAGAENIEWADATVTVTAKGDAWTRIRDALKTAGCDVQEAGLKYVPLQTVEVTEPTLAQRIVDLMKAIEDDPDISEVHTNAEISEEAAKQLTG